jgi:hypothetical protein
MNGTLVVQERACPRCATKRTVRIGTSATSFCFNCRTRWSGGSVASPARPVLEAAVQRRWEIYRAAVRAGFYTDRLVSP